MQWAQSDRGECDICTGCKGNVEMAKRSCASKQLPLSVPPRVEDRKDRHSDHQQNHRQNVQAGMWAGPLHSWCAPLVSEGCAMTQAGADLRAARRT